MNRRPARTRNRARQQAEHTPRPARIAPLPGFTLSSRQTGPAVKFVFAAGPVFIYLWLRESGLNRTHGL
ncbi:hypothetical protein DPQ25_04255 [Hydrogeniiclostridium mannosilyticum]|uniref:Uncharacterized protein n=1 Tax=Hydrogeniiclostridium mannosilyticum TaxID=2764322 RepID=A0A328UHT7_9FIRM|nr:hypothetical protein DPQ25_04255 [Hydrogeniiclostridium mannosilyticum]